MTNKDLPAEEAHWLLKEIAEQKAEIERLQKREAQFAAALYAVKEVVAKDSPQWLLADQLARMMLSAPPSEPSGCPEHGMEHFFEGMCIKCGVVPAVKSSPPPSHGGRPMTLRECMDAEEPSACDHDLQSPNKTLKATMAPRYGWRCTICKAEWYPERTNEQHK